VRKRAVEVPKPVGLQAVKMDDLRARGPRGIVFEKVREKVVTVVGNDRDGIGLAHRECVHDDLVSLVVDTIVNRALKVFEVVLDLAGEDLKPASLNREDAGVDPVPL
jgi:hypothetical protein